MGSQTTDISQMKEAIKAAANDVTIAKLRHDLAELTTEVFASTGLHLNVGGWIIGPDRVSGESIAGNGSDETVAVALLLRIAAQLTGGAADLFEQRQTYAAGALLRQLVEVEYLAWAIDSRDRDGERWLRSSKRERETFFRPAKLREAAKGKFRGKDYGFHCELGGHPVPTAGILLNDDGTMAQLLLSDMLGHTGRIWDHCISWARRASHGEVLLSRSREMSERYRAWEAADPLARLPPPP